MMKHLAKIAKQQVEIQKVIWPISAHAEDSYAPPVAESTRESVSALSDYLPKLMESYRNEIGPTELSKVNAAKMVSPVYQQMMADLYKQFSPQLAQTDTKLLQDSGPALAQAYKTSDEGLNPEYYSTRAEGADKLSQLLGSINLDNPNPEAERLVNQENVRSGNIANPSATTTTANALQFGNERMKRMGALGSAINQATQFLGPAQNTQFNPATTALRRSTSEFGGQKAGNEAFSSGGDLLNNISGFQNNAMNINANRRDALDRVNETMSAI